LAQELHVVALFVWSLIRGFFNQGSREGIFVAEESVAMLVLQMDEK